MKVFISWSGDRSKAIGEKLSVWIPDVIQAVEPWISEADIKPGMRWADELARALQQIRFGIICLTPENLGAAWLLFETGALSKTLKNTSVCPYLCGVAKDAINGPLTQFQAVDCDRAGTFRLVQAVNEALGDTALEADRLERSFDSRWPELESDLSQILAHQPAAVDEPDHDDKLDEILNVVRAIENKLSAQP